MQKTLDLSIKKHETGTIDGAFRTKRSYPAYMNNQEWLAFVTEMEKKHPSAFEEYGAGSGGELKVKGDFPPKMASYGSSSRMIYELSKDICDFRFEYKLPTTVGGIANMDGYLETENTHIFIEAKCREPYGAKPHLIEKRYENLFRYINDDVTNSLHLKVDSLDSKMQVTFSAGDMVLSSFDIKQMICHLLGIATKFLHKPTEKKISFLYLCYNPRLIPLIDELKGIERAPNAKQLTSRGYLHRSLGF